MSSIDMNLLNHNIRNWVQNKGLKSANTANQLLKLMEEVGETAEAHNKQDMNEFIDGLGDIYVVLNSLCEQNDLTIEQVALEAWGQIKDRKGQMRYGTFVKEDDLHD